MYLTRYLYITIMFTSSDEKLELGEMIEKEQGTLKEAFCKDHNYLLSNAAGGEKWLFAHENDIPVLSPDWIRDCVRAKGNY